MGRPLRHRPDPDGSLTFHAFNRADNRVDVFQDDGDHVVFLDALVSTKTRHPFGPCAYGLMTNHVHLVLRPDPGCEVASQSLATK